MTPAPAGLKPAATAPARGDGRPGTAPEPAAPKPAATGRRAATACQGGACALHPLRGMRHVNLAGKGGLFEVVAGTKRSQAASMVLQPGKSTGDAENRHQADQWLYVIEGQGTALVSGREVSLAPGTLLLIEAGEAHEIRNTGEGPLRTLDFYAPPAY